MLYSTGMRISEALNLKIENYDNVIFWSFNRKEYRKINWWSKTASIDISNRLTIRTANTIKKIVKM